VHLDIVTAGDGTPLTKTFTQRTGGWDVDQYPQVSAVSTTRTTVESIEQLHEALKLASDVQGAILKGNTLRTLKNESRSGLTDVMAATSWLCLDLDSYDAYPDPDALLLALGMEDVTYIFHHSASAGITGPAGSRGHIFLLLAKEVSPAFLKTWLRVKNTELQALADAATLTKTGRGIKYALDPSVADNTRLLYVSDPIIIGGEDPIAGERLILVKREKSSYEGKLSIPSTSIEQLEAPLLKKLRTAAGYDNRSSAKYTPTDGQQVLNNPEPGTVTDSKNLRGFVYININGGDSWGYYFPDYNPRVVYNFKNEPPFLLEAFDPTYYETVKTEVLREVAHKAGKPDPASWVVTLGRVKHQNCYFKAITSTDDLLFLDLEILTRADHVKALSELHQVDPDPIPYELVYDPNGAYRVDSTERLINEFLPTKYMIDLDECTALPTVVDECLSSICNDEVTKIHFINWLAYLWQYRDRPKTGWIFSGTTGTGKDFLYEKILTPLLGRQNVIRASQAATGSNYTPAYDKALLVSINEVDPTMNNTSTQMQNWKALVTDETIPVNIKWGRSGQFRNHCALMLFTNNHQAAPLEATDRRFNAAPRQSKKWAPNIPLVDSLDEIDPNILWMTAAFLQHYEVNTAAVRVPLENETRETMKEAGETNTHQIAHAIATGDMDYFVSYFELASLTAGQSPYAKYHQTICAIYKRIDSATPPLFTREEVRCIFHYLMGNDMHPISVGRKMKPFGLEEQQRAIGDSRPRVYVSSGIIMDSETSKQLEKATNIAVVTPTRQTLGLVK
jgi:hypothetical protein